MTKKHAPPPVHAPARSGLVQQRPAAALPRGHLPPPVIAANAGPLRSGLIQGRFQGGGPRLVMPPGFTHAASGALLTKSAPVPTLQRKGNAFALPPGLLNLNGVGQPLPDAVRTQMEDFFSADFSDVRVHIGPAAPSIGALAFAVGSQIHFAQGQYNPGTPQGRALIGHELTHVVQQRQGRVRSPFGGGMTVVQDPVLEAEADRMGARAALHSGPSVGWSPPVRPLASREDANAALQTKKVNAPLQGNRPLPAIRRMAAGIAVQCMFSNHAVASNFNLNGLAAERRVRAITGETSNSFDNAGYAGWKGISKQMGEPSRMPFNKLIKDYMKLMHLDADGEFTCPFCKGKRTRKYFSLDHKVPWMEYSLSLTSHNLWNASAWEIHVGCNDPANLMPVCRNCNSSKGDREYDTDEENEWIEKREQWWINEGQIKYAKK